MVEPEIPLGGGSHSEVVRVGQTVRRVSRSHSVSSAVFDLLRHVEREGFAGAPRALGFDDQGREVLSYIDIGGEIIEFTEFWRSQQSADDKILDDRSVDDRIARGRGHRRTRPHHHDS